MSYTRKVGETTVYVIGKCPTKGCKTRKRNTCAGQIVTDGRYTWTVFTVPAAEPYGTVIPHLGKGSDRHNGWGRNPRPSAWLANNPHAYDAVWLAAVTAAGWVCAEHDRFMVTVTVAGVVNAEKPCTSACQGATGPSCECVCGGEGHGGKWN